VFLIEPEGILFLGDIDLSSFGPFYGDAWSNLEDFESSPKRVADIGARTWATFHHVGIIEDPSLFREKLDRFASRIPQRDEAILSYLERPRTVAEMISHRFLYPEHVKEPFVDAIEKRTVAQHLARLESSGRVARTAPEALSATYIRTG